MSSPSSISPSGSARANQKQPGTLPIFPVQGKSRISMENAAVTLAPALPAASARGVKTWNCSAGFGSQRIRDPGAAGQPPAGPALWRAQVKPFYVIAATKTPSHILISPHCAARKGFYQSPAFPLFHSISQFALKYRLHPTATTSSSRNNPRLSRRDTGRASPSSRVN